MARYLWQSQTKDQNGRIIFSATVSVYLAGTTTAASVYTASAGGTAVNSVTSSATTGWAKFYVDTTDYAQTQTFKIVISKANFTSTTIDEVAVYPHPYSSAISGASVSLSAPYNFTLDEEWETIPFNTEAFDIGSDFNTTTYQFTVPTTGYYLCTYIIHSTLGANEWFQVSWYKNTATQVGPIMRTVELPTGEGIGKVSAAGILYLTAADTMELKLYWNKSSVDFSTIAANAAFSSAQIWQLA